MNIERRHFIKGCTAVALVLPLPGVAMAGKGAINNALSTGADPQIEKSIKASFGGGFALRTHTQSAGLTYADIEHSGIRYAVVSADLLDWKIVKTL